MSKEDRLTRTIREVVPSSLEGRPPEYRLAVERSVRQMVALAKHHHEVNQTDINKQFASICLQAGLALPKAGKE